MNSFDAFKKYIGRKKQELFSVGILRFSVEDVDLMKLTSANDSNFYKEVWILSIGNLHNYDTQFPIPVPELPTSYKMLIEAYFHSFIEKYFGSSVRIQAILTGSNNIIDTLDLFSTRV